MHRKGLHAVLLEVVLVDVLCQPVHTYLAQIVGNRRHFGLDHVARDRSDHDKSLYTVLGGLEQRHESIRYTPRSDQVRIDDSFEVVIFNNSDGHVFFAVFFSDIFGYDACICDLSNMSC